MKKSLCRSIKKRCKGRKRVMIGSLTTLMAISFLSYSVSAARITILDFQDISQKSWYYPAMVWGVTSGVVSGYHENGKLLLKPEKTISEAEFLTMLISVYFNAKEQALDIKSKEKLTNWSDAYYKVAANFHLPVKGLKNPEVRHKEISRGMAAKLITSTLGWNYDTEESIDTLYSLGIAKGQGDKTISGFNPDRSLTRAEAAELLKNLKGIFIPGDFDGQMYGLRE